MQRAPSAVRARWKATCVALVFIVVAVAAAARILAADESTSGQELYDRIVARAAAGNSTAKKAKAAVDAYIRTKNISIGDMPDPTRTFEIKSGNLEQLRLEGFAPWSVTVKNDTRVASRQKLDAYRALRHEAVAELAARSPGREVEVVVTPDRFRSVTKFAKDLGCHCPIKDLRADVWAGDEWVMEVGLLDTKRKDFATGAGELQRDLMEEATSALDLFQGLKPGDLSITVRTVRLTTDATEAKRLRSAPNVLLVDPTTDTYDRFKRKAAIVEVANTPDVFRHCAKYELGRELVPDKIAPVLQSAD